MDFANDYRMTIDGEAVPAEATFDVVNPATGEVFAKAPAATAADLDRAVAAATLAQQSWRAVPLEERKALLVKAAEAIEANADELGALFMREQGRPLAMAREEVLGGAGWFRATAKLDIPIEVTEDSKRRRVEVHHEPLAWSAPSFRGTSLSCWRPGRSVLADGGQHGGAETLALHPLTTLKLGEILLDVFPKGVLNIIAAAMSWVRG